MPPLTSRIKDLKKKAILGRTLDFAMHFHWGHCCHSRIWKGFLRLKRRNCTWFTLPYPNDFLPLSP